MENKNIITPKSKVLQVIEDYPQLEDVLISYVPAFKSLKNPILRKTVAKVATLQQAASIAHIKVEDLVNHLRKEVGQDIFVQTDDKGYNTIKPSWYNPDKIAHELDATEMLSRGEHPVNQVMSDLKNMQSNQIFRLVAPFLPAPLIDKASSLGADHWIVKENESKYVIYFCKQG
jgi:hypothetical protein